MLLFVLHADAALHVHEHGDGEILSADVSAVWDDNNHTSGIEIETKFHPCAQRFPWSNTKHKVSIEEKT